MYSSSGARARTPSLLANAERTRAQIMSRASEIQGGDAWIEDVRVRTDVQLDMAVLAKRDDAVGHVVRALSALAARRERAARAAR